MRQYNFNKPLIETELPLQDTRVYYIDKDEATGELANIMEFTNANWQVKFFVDDVDIWSRSSERLDIPDKIKLNPNSIIAAWLEGNDYEDNVKTAAADLEYIIDCLKDLITVSGNAVTTLGNIADSATTAGYTEIATAVTEVQGAISESVARLVDGHAVAELEALDGVINGTEEEQ